jgi:hypothetical protein
MSAIFLMLAIRCNEQYKDLALSTYMRVKRLMWAGHVVRMEQHRIPKKALGSCFGGGSLVGKPRNRWEYVIQRQPTCSGFGSGRL